MNDTWVYHYTTDTWTNVSTPDAPPARGAHGMVYDAANDVIVMFGGYTGFGCYTGWDNRLMGDIWIYDVKTNIWTNKTPSVGPSGRASCQLAYDSVNDKIVLFGGWDEISRRNDTWIYDVLQNNWTLIETLNSPPARYCHALTSDTNNGIMVLFGGQTNTSNPGDTWFYGIKRYEDTGTYESIPFDLTGKAYFGAIEWSALTSRNTTVLFQIRTADDSVNLSRTVFIGPDGTPGTFYNTSGTYLSSIYNGSRWLQYKVYLATINDVESPQLENITIRYNLIQSIKILKPSGHLSWTGNHLIEWSAKDPDNDSLLFDIILRTGNQSILLVQDLLNNNNEWLWNTNSFENGTYQIIINAKDENPTIPLNVEVHSDEFIIFHPANPSISNAELTLEGFPWLFVIIILLTLATYSGLYFRGKKM